MDTSDREPLARRTGEGVGITMPPPEEEWGERLVRITDPNGVVVELVEWTTPR